MIRLLFFTFALLTLRYRRIARAESSMADRFQRELEVLRLGPLPYGWEGTDD